MEKTVTFGSLFAGFGGFDLGLERAGMKCLWQVEINQYAKNVLTKNWRSVPKFNDVRTVGARELQRVDVIAGGFPCQDISGANPFAIGLSGERSGLWSEYFRIIRELRPKVALIENSPKLAIRGLDRVLCDLASIGYDAEWSTIPACAFGYTFPRERMFVVAYVAGDGRRGRRFRQICAVSNRQTKESVGGIASTEIPRSVSFEIQAAGQPRKRRKINGISSRVERIRGCGNSVVVDVSEWLGRQVMKAL